MTLSYLNTRILIDGKPIKTYSDQQGRTWIEARDGSIYEVEIKNNSSNRVLAVISIDGLNVISGETAQLDPEDGYIIQPYSNLKVRGWRISNEEVKEFIFNFNKQESYSVKLGAGDANLGVIGVAFYEEKSRPILFWPPVNKHHHHHHHHHGGWYYSPNWYTTTSNTDWSNDNFYTVNMTYDNNELRSSSSYHVSTENVDFEAGTAMGDLVESSVEEAGFEAGSLVGTQEIYYDSFENLKKRGIINVEKAEMPKPFRQSKFCRDI